MAASYNTLIGANAGLPPGVTSHAFVLGSAAESVYMGGAQGGGTGVLVTSSGLSLLGAAGISLSGSAGAPGQTLLSGGPAAAPYWSPAPVTLTASAALGPRPAPFYIIAADSPAITISLPSGLPNAEVSFKNMSSYDCTLSGAVVPLYAFASVSSDRVTASGGSALYASDGSLWYAIC